MNILPEGPWDDLRRQIEDLLGLPKGSTNPAANFPFNKMEYGPGGKRLFLKPFESTFKDLEALSREQGPIERIKLFIQLPSSVLLDLAFLPPSLIENFMRKNGGGK